MQDLADDEGLPRPGEKIAGKYLIERELGRGGMGAVFAARNELTGRPVAIKCILAWASTKEIEQRMLREAKALGRIEHPNVIQVLDVGRHDRSLFLVMEKLRGKSLGDLCKGSVVSPATAIRLVMPALSGLAAAHAAGVVHRDLKPDNLFVLLDDRGHPHDTKVLDFGIAALRDDEEKRLTQTGTAIGTPLYMSPEQLRGAREIDPRGDIYALGIILYELLAGRLPYEASQYSALIIEIATEDPFPLTAARADLPRELAAVVHKACAKDARDRFQDVESLARALEPFGAGARFQGARGRSDESRPIEMADAPPRGAPRDAQTRQAKSGSRSSSSPTGLAKRPSGASVTGLSVGDLENVGADEAPRSRAWMLAAGALGVLCAVGGVVTLVSGSLGGDDVTVTSASVTGASPPAVPVAALPDPVPVAGPPDAGVVAPALATAPSHEPEPAIVPVEAPAPVRAPQPPTAPSERRSSPRTRAESAPAVAAPVVQPAAPPPAEPRASSPPVPAAGRRVDGRAGTIASEDF